MGREKIKRGEPGKRAFPFDERPKLVLMPPLEADRLDVKVEPSQEVKEMLREMNRKHAATKNTSSSDVA